jgi:4-amino-4-deoxy-L-arabinose transferase-like glycosyltransferase
LQKQNVSNSSCILFLIVVVSALILPDIIQDGMFMDGMIYCTVAKNLAIGSGTFWDLHLSHSLLNHYHDQPPLTIWIISFFYRIFGNGIYTERIYCLAALISAILLIRSIWKNIYGKGNVISQYWWLPSLFYFITPIVAWSYRNNMEEITMVIFILLSMRAWMKVLVLKKNIFINSITAGVMIFLSTMCKGFQGGFTILVPLSFYFIFRDGKFMNYLKPFLTACAVLIILYGCLYLYLPSREYFQGYFFERLHATFNISGTATTENRFYLLIRLFSELIPVIGLSMIIFLIYRFRIKNTDNDKKKPEFKRAFFFIFTGLTGSLPLMITLEQRGFYLVSSFPFFAMALAIVIIPYLNDLFLKIKINRRVFNTILSIALISVLFISAKNIGRIRRHKEMVEDVHKAGNELPAGIDLAVSKDQNDNWSLYLYFKRYFDIDIIPVSSLENLHSYYFLKSKNAVINTDGFTVADSSLHDYILYKRRVK